MLSQQITSWLVLLCAVIIIIALQAPVSCCCGHPVLVPAFSYPQLSSTQPHPSTLPSSLSSLRRNNNCAIVTTPHQQWPSLSSFDFTNNQNNNNYAFQTTSRRRNYHHHVVVSSSSFTKFRLYSFFGLGPAELVIVALASIIVIGPSKLLNFSKEAGNVAGKMTTAAGSVGDEWSEEIRNIPEEFRKGMELGEIEARSRKAKIVESVEKEDDDNNEVD